ncbi:DoxX family protein, partial [Pseudomonas viridiflava UASWS0038]
MLSNASHLQSGVSPKRAQTLIGWGLLFMRVSVSLLLLHVHGLPKLMHWSVEVQRIEDPFGLGGTLTLGLAVFAEVICPVLLILGVWARLACLPILAVLA